MDLSNENRRLNKLRYFNEYLENILYVTDHDETTFIITCQTIFKSAGKLFRIDFYGYDLQKFKQGYPDSSPFMYLQTEYEKHGLLRTLWIDDFKIKDEHQINKGYGSIMLEQFIKYAKTLDAGYISGELSTVDDGNKDRRNHFYIKHGFSIDGIKIHLSLDK